ADAHDHRGHDRGDAAGGEHRRPVHAARIRGAGRLRGEGSGVAETVGVGTSSRGAGRGNGPAGHFFTAIRAMPDISSAYLSKTLRMPSTRLRASGRRRTLKTIFSVPSRPSSAM